jgi:cytochrome P450
MRGGGDERKSVSPGARGGASERRARRDMFPIGATVTLRDLGGELHPLLRRLRASEPVSWLPVLGGWLVTRRDLALRVLRDARTFTVDDPRFSTARVIGPSMLSLDGADHARHRDPFADAFRLDGAAAGLEQFAQAEAARLVSGFAAGGGAELRRDLAGPLAVAVVAELLGLAETEPRVILSWYDDIVGAVSALAGASGHADGQGGGGPGPRPGPRCGAAPGAGAAEAFGKLSASLQDVIAAGRQGSLLAAAAGAGGLRSGEVVSNAAVLMFGGIETTEGMICNAVLHLLGRPGQLRQVLADPGLIGNAVEESLRLEPAAAVVDRYATADVQLGGAPVRSGDLVSVSLAGAGRDPAFFPDPDRFDVRRANARQNLAFAHGPHYCIGAHLARIEARAAVAALLRLLPGLRLDPAQPAAAGGVVFRKPAALHVRWKAGAAC